MATKMSKTKIQSDTQLPVKEFSLKEREAAKEKLILARVGLLLRHSFFGNMSTRLTLVEASDWCKTLATDGRNFYYNLEFVTKLKPKEAEFGFAHEVLHNIFDHMGRRGDRDPLLSNIAADYAVNQILKDDRIGQIPSWIKIYQDDKYRGKSYEEIYQHLFENSKFINISELGDLFDEHLDGTQGDGDQKNKPAPLTEEEKKAIRDEIKEAMLASAQACSSGNIPAGIARMIKELTEPKMDWRQLLRMNIQSIVKNNFSFTRPNRKAQMSGAIIPGMINEETIDISVALDMSGSISDKQANDFISEIKGIMEEYKDFKLDLWCFDTDVYNYAVFTGDSVDDILNYQVKGGGGTEFEANWTFMKDQGIEPKKFIMFTDGYPCGSWGDEEYCDTLFVIHGNNTIVPPFGQVAYYQEN